MEAAFTDARDQLAVSGFTIGGNWDYDRGSFDRELDEDGKVWLRLPFRVTSGELDAEKSAQDTLIRFESPFVLKHLYEEGIDRDAVGAGMLNQFQDPADADAEIEPEWVEAGQAALTEAENLLQANVPATS
jgi:hypothetical protein